MLTKRYLFSVKNLDSLLSKIIEGVAPTKFTNEHLKAIGFSSSNDRAIIPLLKDLRFLNDDGTPLPRYHSYRDRSRSKAVMAEALREAYEDVFHISETPGTEHRKSIEGLFKSKHNSSDKVAQLQAATFYGLLKNADLTAPVATSSQVPENLRRPLEDTIKQDGQGGSDEGSDTDGTKGSTPRTTLTAELHYTIQVHLPATKDIEVYNAIFRSLRENLLA